MRITSKLPLLLLLVCLPVLADPIGLELLLLVDVSGSVDSTEYNLQKTGYVNAFKNPTIQSNIATIAGGIAVAYAEWDDSQYMKVNWTLITDAASATAFANAIAATSRGGSDLTGPGSAINWGATLIGTNAFDGDRLVMDVSGDGSQNIGANTMTAAANAYAAGITVNGLAILGSETGLAAWYQNNIVTPGHGFLITANDFADFGDAVEQKIGREISGEVPEPASIVLLASLVAGLALRRRFA